MGKMGRHPSLRLAVIIPVLVVLSIAAVLAVIYLRRREKRRPSEPSEDPAHAKRFDTTLGEFHDMREALRPLQHTRAASRRAPGTPPSP
jgi:hypothetical protein